MEVEVGRQLHDPKYGYQLMSDTYIANDIKAELDGNWFLKAALRWQLIKK